MTPNHIHLIRHAEGYHNLLPKEENHKRHDPDLTPEGKQQCLRLAQSFKDMQSVDCIVASPMRRALYTALLVFRDVLKAKPALRIIALPELQETSDEPCDVGTAVEKLREEFAHQPVDLSLVGQDWCRKEAGPFSLHTKDLEARALASRRFIKNRPESNVAVVTHGGFLHFLNEDWVGSMGGVGTGWTNAECRSYLFDESSEEQKRNASIVETEESRAGRDVLTLTGEQHEELRHYAQAHWAEAGWIILSEAVPAGKEVQCNL
jgi:broad specificity phosphatase PhoE